MTILILCCTAWWIIGAASFIFWWTKEFDFETEDILMAFGVGFIGPLAFIVGWIIHGSPFNGVSKTILKKRNG